MQEWFDRFVKNLSDEEKQKLDMELFSEVGNAIERITEMKVGLLKHLTSLGFLNRNSRMCVDDSHVLSTAGMQQERHQGSCWWQLFPSGSHSSPLGATVMAYTAVRDSRRRGNERAAYCLPAPAEFNGLVSRERRLLDVRVFVCPGAHPAS